MVRSWWSSFFMYLQYCSTDLLYMCSKQKHKADHGHKKGHAPRAQEGHSPTGITRPCTEVLRKRTCSSAANTLLRSRASRGHLNLLFRKCVCCIPVLEFFTQFLPPIRVIVRVVPPCATCRATNSIYIISTELVRYCTGFATEVAPEEDIMPDIKKPNDAIIGQVSMQ